MKLPQDKALVVFLRWNEKTKVQVGRFAFRRQPYFEFDPSFLANPLPISPLHFIPSRVLQTNFPAYFDGLPGVFADSLPDGYGRLLVDRAAAAKRVNLTPLDRLAIVGDTGLGALSYEPDHSFNDTKGALILEEIASDACRAVDGASEEVIEKIIRMQGGSGGVRPKVLVAYSEKLDRLVTSTHAKGGYRHYLLKFAAKSDPEEIGLIEYAYWSMAKEASLRVPDARLFSPKKGPGYFASERFDIIEDNRLHVHTAAGLLGIDFRTPSLDYEKLLSLCMNLTRDLEEVKTLFRTAVFNVFAHNRDDHSKQFSFLMDTKGIWKLAPAYDLTYAQGPGGEHFTTIAGEGRNPQPSHLLALADTAGIAQREAKEIIDEVAGAVSNWKHHAKIAAVPKRLAASIGKQMQTTTRSR